MKKVAVLIDGGFLSKCFRKTARRNLTPDDVVVLAKKAIQNEEELFRIYYYDAPPYDGILSNPINNSTTDYKTSSLYSAMHEYHRLLAEKPFVALRLGDLVCSGWRFTKSFMRIIQDEKSRRAPTAADIEPSFRQKAVDMRIGLDIAWMASKRIVDKVTLFAGDRDFIPAMKYARKEGLHVAIVKIAPTLISELSQHSDDIISIDLIESSPTTGAHSI
jgi:uncharacterized LabA/DUF88 family protein